MTAALLRAHRCLVFPGGRTCRDSRCSSRLVYPALRRRHETAKLTASQGPDPSRYLSLVQFQSLVILPIIGFMLGDRIKSLLG